MQSLTLTPLITLFSILLLFTDSTVLAQFQTGGRNITVPTPSTSPATPTSSPTSNNSTTTVTNNSTIGNHTTTSNTNNSTQNSTNNTPIKLTPIPDATGTGGNVPVPAATGGKPNGPFGPDDQYIAGFPKLQVPFLCSVLVMASTIAILCYGSMF